MNALHGCRPCATFADVEASFRGKYMALWQFDVEFVPRSWAEQEGNLPHTLLDEDGLVDTTAAWRNLVTALPRVEALLRSELGAPTNAYGDVEHFGANDEADRYDLVRDGRLIASFSVRIHAGRVTTESLSRLRRIAMAIDCVLLPRGGERWFEAASLDLADAIATSKAAEFVRAPREFIIAAARKLDTN